MINLDLAFKADWENEGTMTFRRLSCLAFVTAWVFTSAAGQNGSFLVDGNHVGELALGMHESQIYQVYPRLRTRKTDLRLEGEPTPAVQIYLSPPSKPALVVRLTGPNHSVDSIQIDDSRFRDQAGIHVGSTIGQIRKAYSKLELAAGEGQYCVYAKGTGLSFCLAIDSQTETALESSGGDAASIPDRIPVRYILVIGSQSGQHTRIAR